jgi:hypothetical protein
VSDLPQALEAALAATAAALDSGDDEGAAAAARRAAEACARLADRGERLAPELLARAVTLQDRCSAAATVRLASLARELETAGRSRRAVDAYQR